MIFENTHKIIEELKTRFDQQENRIKYLEEQNKKLQEENWAEEKCQEMQSQYKAMQEDYYRGFPISKEENQKIQNWKKIHDATEHNADTLEKRVKLEGASGGRFKYIFIPTSIGTVGYIKCSCGKDFCFRDDFNF
jgi:hypothetical protein